MIYRLIRLIHKVKGLGVFQGPFFPSFEELTDVVISGFVVNQVKPRISQSQPGKAKISCKYVRRIIVLQQGLDRDFWGEGIGHSE